MQEIKRDKYLNKLIMRKENGLIKVITGIRRCGKRHEVQCEIDFVINDGTNKYYIQSALNMDNQDKAKQELRPLLSTKDFFKKIVVSKTRMKPWIDDNGVVHVGIYDFLLDESLIK